MDATERSRLRLERISLSLNHDLYALFYNGCLACHCEWSSPFPELVEHDLSKKLFFPLWVPLNVHC